MSSHIISMHINLVSKLYASNLYAYWAFQVVCSQREQQAGGRWADRQGQWSGTAIAMMLSGAEAAGGREAGRHAGARLVAQPEVVQPAAAI